MQDTRSNDVPKQYLDLKGRRVIEHTLGRLLDHPAINGVVVAISEADPWWPETAYANHPSVWRVTGGEERCHSVLNALRELQQRADPMDWVLVHDAARPCVRPSDIGQLINTLADHPVGGLLGIPVHDTVKRAGKGNKVMETVLREGLWRAFTPQMFRLEPLYEALKGALQSGHLVTDESSAMEWAGFSPALVEGHSDNIKITRPEDIELAAFYLIQQHEQP